MAYLSTIIVTYFNEISVMKVYYSKEDDEWSCQTSAIPLGTKLYKHTITISDGTQVHDVIIKMVNTHESSYSGIDLDESLSEDFISANCSGVALAYFLVEISGSVNIRDVLSNAITTSLETVTSITDVVEPF